MLLVAVPFSRNPYHPYIGGHIGGRGEIIVSSDISDVLTASVYSEKIPSEEIDGDDENDYYNYYY